MISRRDNLLVRPWQQRRYDNHRKKVHSATPAIDNRPPLPRQHVALKLKKQQKEAERCDEIEKNNLTLLRRLSYVMRTSRVDNYWSTSQPSFLNRVSMYDTKLPKFEDLYIDKPKENKDKSDRKSKCLACTPQANLDIKIPEERIPWEPKKPTVLRYRSKSVPPRKLVLHSEKTKVSKLPMTNKITPQPEQSKAKKTERQSSANQPQSIILHRGCLKLSVNFPFDTFVKLHEGPHETDMVQKICHCKNVTGVTV